MGLDALFAFRPLSLEVAAATVPDHEVRILDMRFTADWRAEFTAFAPDLVGISALTSTAYVSLALCRAIKREAPETFTVIGGQHPSLRPQDFDWPFVDAIVCGEAEQTFPALVAAVAQRGPRAAAGLPGVHAFGSAGCREAGPPAVLLEDFDASPWPRLAAHPVPASGFRWVDGTTTMAPLEATRGCLHTCSFCTVWKTYGRQFRTKSVNRVVAEFCSSEAQLLMFVDDNPLQRKDYALELARALGSVDHGKMLAILARADTLAMQPDLLDAWCAAGLKIVFVGFETLDQGVMERWEFKKHARFTRTALDALNARDLFVIGSFITPPDWVAGDFDAMTEFVQECEMGHLNMHCLTPFPGTQILQRYSDQVLAHDWRLYDGQHNVLPTTLPLDEFYARRLDLYMTAWRRVHALWASGRKAVPTAHPEQPVRYSFDDFLHNYKFLRGLPSHHEAFNWGYSGPEDPTKFDEELAAVEARKVVHPSVNNRRASPA